MPAAFLERDLEATDPFRSAADVVKDLTRLYKVSERAMSIRLVRLGYLDSTGY